MNCRTILLTTALITLSASAATAAPKWVMYSQRPPANATIFGNKQKNPTLICRVFSTQGFQIGKVQNKKCLVGQNKKALVYTKFAVLTGAKYNRWVPAGTPLSGAMLVGKRGQAMYLCKGTKNGVLHVGKLINGTCYVAMGKQQVWLKNYKFMLFKSGKSPANRFAWYMKPSNNMPKAVRGGSSAAGKLYPCRVAYLDGWFAGKTVGRKCVITHNNKVLSGTSYNVLAVYGQHQWTPYNYRVPTNAAIGGLAQGKVQYFCRGMYKDGIHPGRLVNGRCQIAIGKSVVNLSKFDILTSGAAAYKKTVRAAQAISWKSFSGSIPKNAVQGGVSYRQASYICRGNHNQGLHVGKVSGNRCNIIWGNTIIPLTRFSVLTSTKPLRWDVKLTTKAIAGGYADRQSSYICKAPYKGGIHPGKLVGSRCVIGWGSKTMYISNYSILSRP